MLRLGLTGGIASGKSAVAAMLREMGFAVLDADSLAHKLIEPGQPAYDEVVSEFGPSITAPFGRIDRAKLSAIVFTDRAKLDRLNAIVHPRVAEVIFSQFEVWRRAGVRDAAFVEAALLIESGIHKKLDGLVVAWCTPEQQLERLLARGLSEGEARRRIAAQFPVEEKLRLATEKIDCSGSLEETRRQVAALAVKLRRGQPPR
jgi:dephospho-CoA kinase